LASFAKDAQIIHIDIDPAEISKNVPSFLPIVGEAIQIVKEIDELIKETKRPDWHARFTELGKSTPLPEARFEFSIPRILELVQARIAKSSVVTDVGRHQLFAAHCLSVTPEYPFITSGGLGTMGFGLPAAIGAAFGRPGERIFLISGDGSFLMNCQEMVTAAENELPITALVMNDQNLGMIRQLQDAFYGKRYECQFRTIADYAAMARSMGASGGTATTLAEVERELDAAAQTKGPYIIDCRIPQGENTYPMVTGGNLTSFMED